VAIVVVVLGVMLLTPLAHLTWLPGGALVFLTATLAFWVSREPQGG